MTVRDPEQQARLRALWADRSLRIMDIAKRLGWSSWWVTRMARLLDLPKRKQGQRGVREAGTVTERLAQTAGPGGCIHVTSMDPRGYACFCPAPAAPGHPYCAKHMPKLGDQIPARVRTRTQGAGQTAPIGRKRGPERRDSADPAAPSGHGPGCSRPPSIADFIVAAPPSPKRESGHQSGITVTRCPTVALLPTQATIPAETGAALAAAAQARDAAMVAAMRDKEQKGRARRLQSLAATVQARRAPA